VEEPDYRVVAEHDGFEVRAYGPMVVAETEVEGGFLDGGNQGFRTLAGYIFGGNEQQQSIAMTAPVAMRPSAGGGRSVMTFSMPAGMSVKTLPRPKDPRVALKELPAQQVAAVRFSGVADAGEVQARWATLKRDVQKAGFVLSGDPVFARYDPPWTPSFMRRNELLLPIQAQ
jgi:effector-binding domain-containing protein